MKIIILTLFGLVGPLLAHNNYFLPGDAFFATSLTGEKIKKLKEDGSTKINFSYTRMDNSFMACGNVGYSQLEISNFDSAMKANLILAYEKARRKQKPFFIKTQKEGEEKLTEWNPVAALIYNKGKVSFPLGVKFNEDWQAQGAGKYGGFLDDSWSVLQDWSRGADVPPLKLLKQPGAMTHLKAGGAAHRTIDDALKLNAQDAEIVIVGILKRNSWVTNECPNLKLLAQQINWHSNVGDEAFYLRVTSEGVSYFEYDRDGNETESRADKKGEWVIVEKRPEDK